MTSCNEKQNIDMCGCPQVSYAVFGSPNVYLHEKTKIFRAFSCKKFQKLDARSGLNKMAKNYSCKTVEISTFNFFAFSRHGWNFRETCVKHLKIHEFGVIFWQLACKYTFLQKLEAHPSNRSTDKTQKTGSTSGAPHIPRLILDTRILRSRWKPTRRFSQGAERTGENFVKRSVGLW